MNEELNEELSEELIKELFAYEETRFKKPAIKLFDLLKPPFIGDYGGYIWDKNQFMCGMVRGWGDFQYYENGEALQDELLKFMVDAMNEKYEALKGVVYHAVCLD